MRFLIACAATALAALPFAAAASNITYTQVSNITEPARNTSGVLVNVIAGNLKAFGDLGGSSTIDWAEDSAGGGWSFGADRIGGGSGGWKFNSTAFEYGGGATITKEASVANFLVSGKQDGSVTMTFSTTEDMKCTTTAAAEGRLATTVCTVSANAA